MEIASLLKKIEVFLDEATKYLVAQRKVPHADEQLREEAASLPAKNETRHAPIAKTVAPAPLPASANEDAQSLAYVKDATRAFAQRFNDPAGVHKAGLDELRGILRDRYGKATLTELTPRERLEVVSYVRQRLDQAPAAKTDGIPIGV